MNTSSKARGSASGAPVQGGKAQAPAPADYASKAQTQALIKAGLGYLKQRLQAGDMLSVEEAARVKRTDQPTIQRWIAEQPAIALSVKNREVLLPRWQFDPWVWNALPKLAEALGTRDGWALLAFLESPLGGLNGLTPRQALEQGLQDQVIALAEHDTY